MAAPVDASHSTSDFQATPSFDQPTGLTDGDWLLILLYCWGSFVSGGNKPGSPAGFTELFFINSSTSLYGASIGAYVKKITNASGEPATYDFTDPPFGYGIGGPSNGGYISRITGADPTNAIDDAGAVEGVSSSATTGGIIDTGQAEGLLFVVCSNDVDSAPGTPAGMANVFAGDGGDSNFYSQTLAAQLSGATRSSTLSGSGNWTIGFVTIKPAAGGTDVTPDSVVVEAHVVAPTIALKTSPSPVVTQARVVAPATKLAAAPSPVVVEARVVAPSISLRLSPAPVVAQLRVVAATVALKTTPAPVAVAAVVIAPTVTVGGQTIVTPSPVVLIARVIAPTVTLIGGAVDFVGDSPRVLHSGQLYGREPDWLTRLRMLRDLRRRPRIEDAPVNPDEPAVVRARLERLWAEQEKAEEEWILGL